MLKLCNLEDSAGVQVHIDLPRAALGQSERTEEGLRLVFAQLVPRSERTKEELRLVFAQLVSRLVQLTDCSRSRLHWLSAQ